jgi:hypothetical protein
MKAPSAAPSNLVAVTADAVARRNFPAAPSRRHPVRAEGARPSAAPPERAAEGAPDRFALLPPRSAEGTA